MGLTEDIYLETFILVNDQHTDLQLNTRRMALITAVLTWDLDHVLQYYYVCVAEQD